LSGLLDLFRFIASKIAYISFPNERNLAAKIPPCVRYSPSAKITREANARALEDSGGRARSGRGRRPRAAL